MMKKLMPVCCVALLCTLSLAPLAQAAGGTGVRGAVPAAFADGVASEAGGLTDVERDVLRAAERSSDPQLESLRGGHHGVVVVGVILIFLLIIAIVS